MTTRDRRSSEDEEAQANPIHESRIESLSKRRLSRYRETRGCRAYCVREEAGAWHQSIKAMIGVQSAIIPNPSMIACLQVSITKNPLGSTASEMWVKGALDTVQLIIENAWQSIPLTASGCFFRMESSLDVNS